MPAALDVETGVTPGSTDNDFARFKGLRWDNPLISPAARYRADRARPRLEP